MTDSQKDLSDTDLVNPNYNGARGGESGKARSSPRVRSPKRRKAPKSDSDKRGKKRGSEEMSSEGYMASDASRAGLFPAPPAAIRSAHPLLAPRSGFMAEQFDAPRQGLPMGGAGAAQISASVVGSSEQLAAAEEEPSAEAFARMSRSERKRFREKKRRSEVNKGFDDLMALLLRVDPVVRAEVEETEKCSRRHQSRSSSGEGDNLVLNRVDLISRTITSLDRMSRENVECKALLAEMSQESKSNETAAARQAIKDDRVVLMVPFLSPSGPVISRPSAESTAFPSQQQPLGIQSVAAEGPGASYQNVPFSPVGYHAPRPTGSLPPRFASHLQGYPREETGFNQAYFRAMQDANTGSGLSPNRQDTMGQRGRMM